MKRWTRLTTFEQTIVGIRINETLQTDAFGNQHLPGSIECDAVGNHIYRTR